TARVRDRDGVHARSVGRVLRLARGVRADRARDQRGSRGIAHQVADRRRRARRAVPRAVDAANAAERLVLAMAAAAPRERPLHRRLVHARDVPALAPGLPMIDAALKAAVDGACASIAPMWPLDRFIAVNPFWPRTAKPLAVVAGELAALSGARLLMPRAWYADEWRSGRLRSEHVREAIAEAGADVTEDDLIASFWIPEPRSQRRP